MQLHHLCQPLGIALVEPGSVEKVNLYVEPATVREDRVDQGRAMRDVRALCGARYVQGLHVSLRARTDGTGRAVRPAPALRDRRAQVHAP